MIQSGVDVILKVDGVPVAGQLGANLMRSMSPINITNKINADWEDNLAGVKTWRVSCNGMFVVNANSLQMLEDAFMNNEEINVSLRVNGKNYFGQALITDFPVSSPYNAQFSYNLSLLGTGELHSEDA